MSANVTDGRMRCVPTRICCLSKNGFSNQVISILLDTQTDSYYRRKTRIKQMKMNLAEDTRTFEEIVNAV